MHVFTDGPVTLEQMSDNGLVNLASQREGVTLTEELSIHNLRGALTPKARGRGNFFVDLDLLGFGVWCVNLTGQQVNYFPGLSTKRMDAALIFTKTFSSLKKAATAGTATSVAAITCIAKMYSLWLFGGCWDKDTA